MVNLSEWIKQSQNIELQQQTWDVEEMLLGEEATV
jgi:hypothetical protein